jgi:hypothetical protein
MGKSGEISYTMPTEWAAGCPTWLAEYLSSTDFVIKLVFTIDTITDINTTQFTVNKMILSDSSSEDVFRYTEMTNVKDGRDLTYDYLCLDEEDTVNVIFSSKFNRVDWTLLVGNTNASLMFAQYFNGHHWEALTLKTDTTLDDSTGTKTLYESGYMDFDIPYDWQEITIGDYKGYAVRFYPQDDLIDGVKIAEITVSNNDALTTLGNPITIYANKWTYYQIDIEPNANPNPDERSIVSICLYKESAEASETTIYIASIELITDALTYIKIGGERINSIEAYGDERLNPWVFTTGMVYEIQTQNEDAVVAMPLREITTLRSETNGVAHTVSDVYLVFNLGQYIEKYYQHNLDDIGVNKDEGLPDTRQGDPTCLLSYPGRIFLSINAGDDGYSTVMLRRQSGWHEIYRAPLGCAIYDLNIQVIPGLSTRLWISQDNDILWIPLPTNTWNPVNDDNFTYTHEAMLTTGWITAGFMDIPKFFKSVKLYTEDLVDEEQYITCEYQEDYGMLENCTHWHAAEEVFNTSPFQEVLLSSDYDVVARRIRFRFKLHTNDNTKTPVIKAIVIEALLRFPVKYSYTFNFRLEDTPEYYAGHKDITMRAEDISAILDEWGDAPTVLTMRCNFSPFDNKKVVIEPTSLKPIELTTSNMLYEKHVGQITLLEV